MFGLSGIILYLCEQFGAAGKGWGLERIIKHSDDDQEIHLCPDGRVDLCACICTIRCPFRAVFCRGAWIVLWVTSGTVYGGSRF